MGNSTSPLVSFVVLSYNYARFLRDCLNSILRQDTEVNFEVIVVDDASTDESAEVVRSFSDSRIRLIEHAVNEGHIATVTDGLKEAKGRFIARIDSDDRYRPDFLREMLPIFHQHPSVGLAYADVAVINDSGETTIASSDRVHCGRDCVGNELVALMKENFICAPSVIARRDVWLDALPIPSGLVFHDWYFTLMAARKGDFYYRAKVLADYRVHSRNYHSAITRNKTEEPSIIRLLNQIYSEKEADGALEMAKRRARREVYGSHYLTLATKYFGFGHFADSRRCFLKAIQLQPQFALRPHVMRHLLGTMMGQRPYEVTKRMVKSAMGLSANGTGAP